MPFKLLYRGLEVMCDTIEDIDAFADSLESQKKIKVSEPARNSETAVIKKADLGEPREIEPSKIRAFVSRLAEKQKVVLTSLLNSSSGLNDSDLRNAVGVPNNMALAGVTSVISKAAKAEGINYSDVVVKVVLSAEVGNQSYHYQIAEAAKEELRNALNSKLF